MKRVLFVFGTRPEAIKLAPLIRIFKADPDFETRVCVTAQHREMLDQVLIFFRIRPDYDLNLMKPGQRLDELTALVLTAVGKTISDFQPDLIVVQGDTTTVLASSLAAFYNKTAIAHVEAGLRSGDRFSPFPEELNRLLTTRLSTLHFCPTVSAESNLANEGISNDVFVTGNTVVDALLEAVSIVESEKDNHSQNFPGIDFSKRNILVTCHRRESFGEPIRNIFRALEAIATEFPGINIIYPVHRNPNVTSAAESILKQENIFLLPPVSYPDLVWLMKHSYLIVTDSGGIQEEAPSLGKPVLVTRDVTERMEGVQAGTSKLTGTDHDSIHHAIHQLLTDETAYKSMTGLLNPYGDGKASIRIHKHIRHYFGLAE